MKVIKASAVALAMSAMLAGPVLAQGASSDPQMRGGVQGNSQLRGTISGSGDEEFNAQAGTAEKGGTGTKAKGTVGTARRATTKGVTDGAAGDPAAGSKQR